MVIFKDFLVWNIKYKNKTKNLFETLNLNIELFKNYCNNITVIVKLILNYKVMSHILFADAKMYYYVQIGYPTRGSVKHITTTKPRNPWSVHCGNTGNPTPRHASTRPLKTKLQPSIYNHYVEDKNHVIICVRYKLSGGGYLGRTGSLIMLFFIICCRQMKVKHFEHGIWFNTLKILEKIYS